MHYFCEKQTVKDQKEKLRTQCPVILAHVNHSQSYDDVKPGLFQIASVLVGTLYYNLLSRLSLNAVDILFWSVQQYGRK